MPMELKPNGDGTSGGKHHQDLGHRAHAAQRQAAAIKLRIAGATWEDIAQQLGYAGKAAAYMDVKRALRNGLDELALNREEYRQLELERLDRLTMALWTKAMAGDTRAVDSINRLRIQYARLLGLEAPIQHEVITIDAVTAEIQRLEARLGQRAPAAGGRTIAGEVAEAPSPATDGDRG